MNSRIKREWKTIEAMIRLYCRANHGRGELCFDCRALSEYAMTRLDNCPYGNEKPVCIHCPIHCYKKDMREKVRQVMRFSGPRMLARHPYLAIRHLIDEKLKKSEAKKPATSGI